MHRYSKDMGESLFKLKMRFFGDSFADGGQHD
jgi:hypothetical protein